MFGREKVPAPVLAEALQPEPVKKVCDPEVIQAARRIQRIRRMMGLLIEVNEGPNLCVKEGLGWVLGGSEFSYEPGSGQSHPCEGSCWLADVALSGMGTAEPTVPEPEN